MPDPAPQAPDESVQPTGFLRSPVWWRLLGVSLLLALLGAFGALIFVTVVGLGTELIWSGGPTSAELFSGPPAILVIMTLAGLVVGLLYRFVPSIGAPNVFAGLVSGRIDPRPVPGGLLVSLVSLIGGFSLGPEVPTGMLAGGAASAVADRQGWDDSTRKVTFGSAVSSAYAGLFTSPFVSTMLVLEMAPPRHLMLLPFLGIQVAASLVGFAVFFVVGGFADILSSLSVQDYDLRVWDLGVAAAMAVAAAAIGLLTAGFTALFRRLAAPLAEHVVLRGAIAGIGLGLLAMAVPLTLFSGTSTLPEATSGAAALGVTVLVVSLVAKIAAMTAAQSFGFIGGPIFPLVFAGGVLGAAVHSLVPDIPLALAVTTGMAAVPAAVLPIPLTLGVLAIVIAGTSLELGAPVLTASLLATVLVRGLKRVEGGRPPPW